VDSAADPGAVQLLLDAAERNDVAACWDHLLKLVPDFMGQTHDAAASPPTTTDTSR
jgi:hypothetical protein